MNRETMDPFLLKYTADEIKIAAEFLSNWIPFLSRGLCKSCTGTLTDAIRSLETGGTIDLNHCKENHGDCSAYSSTKDSSNNNHHNINNDDDDIDTHSLGSWKDEADGLSDQAVQSLTKRFDSAISLATTSTKKSWADIAQEDELAEEEDNEVNSADANPNNSSLSNKPKVELSREQREYIRFKNVQRKKDFASFERINGKFVNILKGLELHTGVFSAAEQRRIVNFVGELQKMGKNGQLKERTFSSPQKWMRGKGRVTLQFGCCYNYAVDKNGNPPGILKNEPIDPLPQLFKTMIKRLIRWHVLPPSCVPDCCIVNIYDEGDCIPPHIDHHDFVRPFCTVSFLSECEILFGSNLKIMGPGEFSGSYSIPLPLGSVLVLNGNGADVAKHCVPAVPSKRISITFRKMDESKHPLHFVPEPDLQGLEPLRDDNEEDKSNKHNGSRSIHYSRKPVVRQDRSRGVIGQRPDAHYSGQGTQTHHYRPKYQN